MIKIEDVKKAQEKWGEGIVAISEIYRSNGDYVERARSHIDSLYGYKNGPVLFKPTFAVKEQFRPTFEGALSYFVGENGICIEDKGFAIKGWKKVRFENDSIIIDGNTAMSMGNYYFTDMNDTEVKVEFSFGYILDSSQALKIHLHHSSMPAKIQ